MPLGSIFYTTHPFVEELMTENFGRKSLLLAMEQFFFEILNYAMEWCHHKKKNEWKRFFKLASVKSVKTSCDCFFFFHYFKYYGQIFSRTAMPYLIARVERKE